MKKPFNIKNQISCLYAYAFTSSLSVVNAVWVVLLCARGYSLWQVGIAEGFYHIVSLLAEIPSGMAADLLGRRRTLALSGVLGALSGMAMAAEGGRFALVCLSMALGALAGNLISGTQEAIAYDSLKLAGREGEYMQVDARVTQLQVAGEVISHFCSVLSGFLSFGGLYMLNAAISLPRTAAALAMREPIVTQSQAERARHTIGELPRRMAAHTKTAVQFLRTNPRMAAYIAADGFICMPCYLSIMYLQQRLADMGLAAMWLGVPMLLVAGGNAVGAELGRRLKPMPLLPLYAVCAALTAVCTLMAGAAPVAGAVLGAFGIRLFTEVWMLHAQRVMNNSFPSDQRATLVSVDSMAYSVVMIAASPLTGLVSTVTNMAGAGLCALAALLALSAALAAARVVAKRGKIE